MVLPVQARANPPAATSAGPPPVTVLTQGADNGNGDIFIAPTGDSTTYANGPEIINTAGQVLWFQPVPAGEEAVGFRPQFYHGRPVLTWWQGTGLGGLSTGTDYIYNDHYVGHDEFTFFDSESSGTPLLPYSRAVTVRLNPVTKVATLLASDDQPEGLAAASQGNAQATRNGDEFVGWGALPYLSEFSPSGQLLFNARFPAGVNTYRAYRAPWIPFGGHGRRG